MEESPAQVMEILKTLFDSQPLAVLATQRAGQPYTSLVAFIATADLRSLIFATTRATRKYANLVADSRVAMHIDNRSNQPSDLHLALSVTATGLGAEMREQEKAVTIPLYLTKHPHLREFVESPTCALVRVTVDTYYLVRQFQNVIEVHMRHDADYLA